MFTGLVETTGTITDIKTNQITIKSAIAKELNIGESIAVNGACLTVTEVKNDTFCADISPETRSVTNFEKKSAGAIVNLERAMLLSSRLDGHIVYGHIDTTAKITNIINNGKFISLSIKISPQYNNYIIKKGSIAVDGVSLTIANESRGEIEIAVIPHTWEITALKALHNGDSVNIEFDIISKYIEKNLNIYHNKSRINLNFLEENGFA